MKSVFYISLTAKNFAVRYHAISNESNDQMQRPLKMNKANLNAFAELMNLLSMYYKLLFYPYHY